jgi:hypothetical protein
MMIKRQVKEEEEDIGKRKYAAADEEGTGNYRKRDKGGEN